jgi:hypothetical protein
MVTAASSPTAATVGTEASILAAQVPRLVSVDVLRGLVMVIMALDHTRDFMSYLRFPPEDMAQTYGALFFTRFITHFCDPYSLSWPEQAHSSPLTVESHYNRSPGSSSLAVYGS